MSSSKQCRLTPSSCSSWYHQEYWSHITTSIFLYVDLRMTVCSILLQGALHQPHGFCSHSIIYQFYCCSPSPSYTVEQSHGKIIMILQNCRLIMIFFVVPIGQWFRPSKPGNKKVLLYHRRKTFVYDTQELAESVDYATDYDLLHGKVTGTEVVLCKRGSGGNELQVISMDGKNHGVAD